MHRAGIAQTDSREAKGEMKAESKRESPNIRRGLFSLSRGSPRANTDAAGSSSSSNGNSASASGNSSVVGNASHAGSDSAAEAATSADRESKAAVDEKDDLVTDLSRFPGDRSARTMSLGSAASVLARFDDTTLLTFEAIGRGAW